MDRIILITIEYRRVAELKSIGTLFFTLNRSSTHRHPAHLREIQALWSQATTQEIIHRHAVLVR